mmetsp:Transcript_62617/g.147268  ORF Transcript_62617/g.147268 Transcript_62617/m.147268 type:complete len:212 (-) Transcript_62617:774-1409(-)
MPVTCSPYAERRKWSSRNAMSEKTTTSHERCRKRNSTLKRYCASLAESVVFFHPFAEFSSSHVCSDTYILLTNGASDRYIITRYTTRSPVFSSDSVTIAKPAIRVEMVWHTPAPTVCSAVFRSGNGRFDIVAARYITYCPPLMTTSNQMRIFVWRRSKRCVVIWRGWSSAYRAPASSTLRRRAFICANRSNPRRRMGAALFPARIKTESGR